VKIAEACFVHLAQEESNAKTATAQKQGHCNNQLEFVSQNS